MKKVTMTFILGILMVFLLTSNSFAFKVSPAIIDKVELARGQTGVANLTLIGSKRQEKIKIYPTDVRIDRDGNRNFEKFEDWKYSAREWIDVEAQTLTLSKNKAKKLEFKIKVPYMADPGQYYACIMIEPTEFTPVDQEIDGVNTTLNTKSRIAVPIILTVPGREEKLDGDAVKVEVENISFSKRERVVAVVNHLIQQYGRTFKGMEKEKIDSAVDKIEDIFTRHINGKISEDKAKDLLLEIESQEGQLFDKEIVQVFMEDKERILDDLDAKQGLNVFATFENTGNVIEEVTGEAKIVSTEQNRVYNEVVLRALNSSTKDGMGKVFPELKRDFEGKVTRPLPEGNYEVRVSFDYGRKYRKARTREEFEITESIAADEDELLIISSSKESLEFSMARGGTMLKGLEINNLSFEPTKVEVSSNSWMKVQPDEFTLQPDRSKNLRIAVEIPKGEEPKRSGKIVFKPEKGKSIEVEIEVTENSKGGKDND